MKTKEIDWRAWLARITTLAMLAVICLGVYAVSMQKQAPGLFVRFLDVGQGDAELIQTPSGQNILIDGGPDSRVISELDKFIPFYGRTLDAVILTHPHADHVAGLVDVLGKYQVKHAFISGVLYTTPDYLEFLKLLKDKKIPTEEVKAGDRLELGVATNMDFLFPLVSLAGTNSDNVNNTSIVTRLSHGSKAALFMGDLESEGQDRLLASGQEVSSTLYKAPHHGSKDSVNQKFFEAVRAKFVVIEVGKDNKFGHPTAKALDLFKSAIISRTDQEGTISFQISEDEIRRVR